MSGIITPVAAPETVIEQAERELRHQLLIAPGRDTLDRLDAALFGQLIEVAKGGMEPKISGLSDGLGERVARLIEPDAWEAFDKRAVRKGWGPGERRMEMLEEIGRGRRLASSCDRARAILAMLYGDELPLVLGERDVAASPIIRARCPICLTANPCPRHSDVQQIKALADPEYLEGLVPPCDLAVRS